VIELKQAPGKSFSYKELKAAIEKNKPAALFLCQVGLQLKKAKNAIWSDATDVLVANL